MTKQAPDLLETHVPHDDLVEIVSMLTPLVKDLVRLNVENARAQAVAELAEQDLSEGAKSLMQRHIHIADLILAALNQEQTEVNNLNKQE